jgi:hypothetical protein
LFVLLVAAGEFGVEGGDEEGLEGDLVVRGANACAFEELVGVSHGGLGRRLFYRQAISKRQAPSPFPGTPATLRCPERPIPWSAHRARRTLADVKSSYNRPTKHS